MVDKLSMTLVCSLALSLTTHAQEAPHQPFSIAEIVTIHSNVLNEDRNLYIYNPDVNSGNRLPAYPVLYVLDENHMTMVTGLIKYLSAYNEQLPATIVVGIDGAGQRIRDLTPTHSLFDAEGKVDTSPDSWLQPSGGGEKFLQFVREEAMPYVQAHYKTAPFTIVGGHSVGGLTAVYTLLYHPEMFNAYIAISPSLWWDEGYLLPLTKEKLASLGKEKKFLFFCDSPENGPFDRYVKEFHSILKQNAPPQLSYSYVYYPDETHGSTAAKAYYDGLRFLYPHWDIAQTDTTAALVEKHYQQISERLGYHVEPPLVMVSDWGSRFLNQTGHTDDALELFQLNAKNFPETASVYEDLGDGYSREGDKAKALDAYAKALQLDPNDAQAKSKQKALLEGK